MRYSVHNNIIGTTLIILGIIAIVIAIGPLLLPLLLAIGGIFLINLGLRLSGRAPIIIKMHKMWQRHNWRC